MLSKSLLYVGLNSNSWFSDFTDLSLFLFFLLAFPICLWNLHKHLGTHGNADKLTCRPVSLLTKKIHIYYHNGTYFKLIFCWFLRAATIFFAEKYKFHGQNPFRNGGSKNIWQIFFFLNLFVRKSILSINLCVFIARKWNWYKNRIMFL